MRPLSSTRGGAWTRSLEPGQPVLALVGEVGSGRWIPARVLRVCAGGGIELRFEDDGEEEFVPQYEAEARLAWVDVPDDDEEERVLQKRRGTDDYVAGAAVEALFEADDRPQDTGWFPATVLAVGWRRGLVVKYDDGFVEFFDGGDLDRRVRRRRVQEDVTCQFCEEEEEEATPLGRLVDVIERSVFHGGLKRGSITLGLVARSKAKVSAETARRPALALALASLLRRQHHLDALEFTSVQINADVEFEMHADCMNDGPTAIIGLGEYTGGELWVDDGTECGATLDIRGRFGTFDGTRPHRTCRIAAGRRITLAFYTHKRHATLGEGDRRALGDLGFRLPAPISKIQAAKLKFRRTQSALRRPLRRPREDGDGPPTPPPTKRRAPTHGGGGGGGCVVEKLPLKVMRVL